MTISPGILYIVATPIGNLNDLSTRALHTLEHVQYIAAEDTRHSGPLLKHFGIHKPLKALHDHNERQCLDWFSQTLSAGHSIALISDAGTPLIADPGYHVVRHVTSLGYRVVPIPGACALISALSTSGLATDRFCFEGFLPAKSVARQQQLIDLSQEPRTLVFYETPHRIVACLHDMQHVFGPHRLACLARELTKQYETIKTTTLEALCAFVQQDTHQQRGEFVVIVAGAPPATSIPFEAEELRLFNLLRQQLPLKTASQVMADYTGKRKKAFYDWAISQDSADGR